MVSVWAADITPLLIEETYQAYYDKVPEWRKDKADKLKNVDDKARSVGAWILWEKMKKALRLPESAVFNLSQNMYCVPVVTVKMFRQAVMWR